MSFKAALRAGLIAAVLGCAAAPAGASVQVGASGWQWGNPLPQGNTLRTTSFAGATGYAAGDFGTLLKTTDGGASWSGLPVGTLQGLSVVQALDANTVFAGGGCVARRSTDGGATFTAVRFTPVESRCRTSLRDFSFVSADAGFLLMDDGSVLTTVDGGATFAPRTAVPDTRARGGFAQPGGVVFLDARVGYATSGGQIFQTLDGAVSWRGVGGDGRQLDRLWFLDRDHGFAVGAGGALLRSDDGGASWVAKPVAGGGQELTSIRCNADRVCLLTTLAGTVLIRATDAGDGPSAVITPSSDPVLAAAFASPARVVAAGANGTTVLSDDAGQTFATLGGRLGGRYDSVRAGGEPGTAYAPGEDGALAKTTDGGRSWTTGNVPTSADLFDVSFPARSVGYALDADGGLFRTADGGAFWRTLGTGSARRPNALVAADEDVVLVVGPRGVRRSADAGETFDQVRSRAVLRTRLSGATAGRDGALFAWGQTALARSLDDGRTWKAAEKPGRSGRERRALRIQQVSFATARAGLLLDTRGRVWRTGDGGGSWTLLPAVGGQPVAGIAAASARAAYLVLDGFAGRAGGCLLRTTDAGETWQPQCVADAPIQPFGFDGTGGIATARGVDYLLAGDASLLFSTRGGVAGARSALTLSTRARRLPRPHGVTVTGRLTPASAGAQVQVSMLTPGGGWRRQVVNAASNGTFATAWRVPRGTTTFVAQWAGDFKSAGAGSHPLTVTVGARRR